LLPQQPPLSISAAAEVVDATNCYRIDPCGRIDLEVSEDPVPPTSGEPISCVVGRTWFASHQARLACSHRTGWYRWYRGVAYGGHSLDGLDRTLGKLVRYRRRATAIPNKNATSSEPRGASRAMLLKMLNGMPGFRPSSIAAPIRCAVPFTASETSATVDFGSGAGSKPS
jgi:hypothetical protein